MKTLTRTKNVDYMKTEFLVEVKDTHHYNKDGGINFLETRTSLGGISFTTEKVSEGIFKILSRPHFPKYAIQDHFFLIRNFESQFGRVYDIKMFARGVRIKDTLYNIPYVIEGDKLKPLNEWQQSYQSFDLEYPNL